jgi:hypothetical protein
VISLRVDSDALQGVEPAESNSELRLAELLDGLGVALGDVTLLGKPVGPSGDRQAAEGGQPRESGDDPGSGRGLRSCSILLVVHVVVQRRRHPPDQQYDPGQPE